MKFTFENLGYIDKGEITPGKLTLICGDNNTGKTYINYGIYGLLYTLTRNPIMNFENPVFQELNSNRKTKIDLRLYLDTIKKILKGNSDNFIDNLPNVFSSGEKLFKDTKFTFELLDDNFDVSKGIEEKVIFLDKSQIIFTKEKNSYFLNINIISNPEEKIPDVIISDILTRTIFNFFFQNKIKNPFIITSERTGVSLFWKELDINKNILIDKILKSKNVNVPDLFFTDLSRYPISIKHNIDIIRDTKEVLNMESCFKKNRKEQYDILTEYFKNFINGKFKIIGEEICLEPNKLKKRNKSESLPLHLASSASRSVLLLWLYINSLAKENDILLIDEPELNLHPSNQIVMAKLLANIANAGIDVLITTHSDYIVKEINNLIMLSNNFKDKERIMSDYGYLPSDILAPESVKAYFTKSQKLIPAKVDKYGIDLKLFDDTIYSLNKISNDIYYSITE